MKIFQVLHGFPPETLGGTERTVEALALAMQALGHDVAIVAGSLETAPPHDVGREQHAGLEVLRLHRDDLYFESWFKAYSPGVSAAFDALLDEFQPDVVHVHHWIRLTSDLVRRARARGCVTAVTMHDYYTAMASPVRRGDQVRPEPPPSPGFLGGAEIAEAFEFHRRDLRADVCAAHVRLVPSRSHGEGLQAMAEGPLGDLQVSPPPLLQRPPRLPAPTGTRQKRLVTWGTIYADKGLETVLQALRRAGDGWQLEVWGAAHEADYRQHVEQLASGLAVDFRGAFSLDDLVGIRADYAVLPSLCHESYGLTLDEAQCLGLPMIASDLPAYRERAPEGSCAFYPAGDADALAALLGDDAALGALRAPEAPVIATAAELAPQLLDLYARAQGGEFAPVADAPEITDRDRLEVVFRRAERRLWTALQQGDPPAPPDHFMQR